MVPNCYSLFKGDGNMGTLTEKVIEKEKRKLGTNLGNVGNVYFVSNLGSDPGLNFAGLFWPTLNMLQHLCIPLFVGDG